MSEHGTGVSLDLVGLTSATERLAGESARAVMGAAADVREVNGRYFLREVGGGWREVERAQPVDDEAHLPTLVVADVESLCAWAHEWAPTLGELRISRAGMSSAIANRWRAPGQSRDMARMEFYSAGLPPSRAGYLEWRGWLDGVEDLAGHATDATGAPVAIGRETLEQQLAQVSTAESSGATIRMTGAVVQVAGKSESGATFGGSVPRVLSGVVPFGDPAHRLRVEFRLTIKVAGSAGLVFETELHRPEAAREAWIAWARDVVAASGVDWPIFVTP